MSSDFKHMTFITGTDTGSGKTLLTALLLVHLRGIGCHALAMKPFCSGDRDDVRFLQKLQPGDILDDSMNPFFFPEPLAPLVAGRRHKGVISLGQALKVIRKVKTRCDHLLIEGIGGVLVPLGEGYSALNIMEKLKCAVIVTARNKLGVINSCLLTIRALKTAGIQPLTVALMGTAQEDLSCKSNPSVLDELLAPVQVISIPFLGRQSPGFVGSRRNEKKLTDSLARLSHTRLNSV